MRLSSPEKRRAPAGFTLIEVIVVLGIMGIFVLVSYPSVLSVMAVRNLENKTREVQTYLQMTKLRSVSTKIVHRTRFYQPEGTYWAYEMERLEADGTWARVGSAPRKTIPANLNVTITFPDVGDGQAASFSALGTFPAEAILTPMGFPAFNPNLNSITLQSPKLQGGGQMDERMLTVFMGGAINYVKRASS